MSATLRLLSPDLLQPLSLAVEPTMTILQVKESIMAQWPAGAAVTPTQAQLRIIHQGKFLTDDKKLSDCKVAAGETTAMHIALKMLDAKVSDTSSNGDDKTPKCSCCIS